MADPNMNQDWHTQAFRSRLVAQIEDSMRASQTSMGRSAVEMENHVYMKAQTRDEYMALVARLILHVKDHPKNRAQQGMAPGVGMGPHGHVGAGGPPGMGDVQGGIDPMNALQNLARQGGQPPNQQGMIGPQHPMHPQHRQQLSQQQAALLQQQRGQLQQRPTLQMSQQQQQQLLQQRAMQKPPLERQDAFIVTSPQNVQQMPGQGLVSSATMQFQAAGGINSMGGMNRGGPMMPGQGPMPQTFLAMGGQQGQMNMGNEMSPIPQSSPAPGLPSPSPQPNITPSPANRGMLGAPSPSAYLNTPGNPAVSAPSPGNAQHMSTEEQMYLEKLYMLSKYIEPLRRCVNNLEKNKDEESKKNYTKMKNLLDILTDANKRVSMSTLLRCEAALNNWHSKNQDHSSGSSVATSRDSGSSMLGQPLYDAIAAYVGSPTLNHTLQRTFGPAMSALLGEGIKCPSPPRKRKREEMEEEKREGKEKDALPLVLQREIANLGNRFRVSMDPLHHASNRTMHLVCKLDDLNLPSVPPVLVTIPPDYPQSSPVCEPNDCPGYDASNFFKTIGSIMSEMMRRMSHYSLTALLNAWEMSVRKACIPSMTSGVGMLHMF